MTSKLPNTRSILVKLTTPIFIAPVECTMYNETSVSFARNRWSQGMELWNIVDFEISRRQCHASEIAHTQVRARAEAADKPRVEKSLDSYEIQYVHKLILNNAFTSHIYVISFQTIRHLGQTPADRWILISIICPEVT